MKNILTLTIGSLVGFSLGFLIPKGNSNASDKSLDNQHSKSNAALSSPNKGEYKYNQKAVDKKFKGFVESFTSWRDLDQCTSMWEDIKRLSPDKLIGLLEDTKYESGKESTGVLKMMIITQLMKSDPNNTIEYLKSTPRVGSPYVMQGALKDWMVSDPDRAFKWFEDNQSDLHPRLRKSGLEAYYITLKSKEDPQWGIKQAAKIKAQESNSMHELMQRQNQDGDRFAMTGVGARSAETYTSLLVENEGSPEVQAQLWDSMKEDDFMTKGVESNYLDYMVTRSPEEALDFISKRYPGDEKRQEELKSEYYNRLSTKYPEEAVKLVANEHRGKPNAGDKLSQTFSTWIAQDPKKATEWINQNAQDFDSDTLFSDAGNALLNQSDFGFAGEVFSQLHDPELRSKNLGTLYDQYSSQDSGGAREWLNSQPAETQEAINMRQQDSSAISPNNSNFTPPMAPMNMMPNQ